MKNKKSEIPHELLAVQLFRIGAAACAKADPAKKGLEFSSLSDAARAGWLATAKHVFDNFELKSKTTADTEIVTKIRAALDGYHIALDRREHGGIAQDQFVRAVQEILNQPWKRGAK